MFCSPVPSTRGAISDWDLRDLVPLISASTVPHMRGVLKVSCPRTTHTLTPSTHTNHTRHTHTHTAAQHTHHSTTHTPHHHNTHTHQKAQQLPFRHLHKYMYASVSSALLQTADGCGHVIYFRGPQTAKNNSDLCQIIHCTAKPQRGQAKNSTLATAVTACRF